MQRKKITIVLLLLLVLIGGSIIFSLRVKEKGSYMLMIDGKGIDPEEISMYIQEERAMTASWFYQNYQADSSEDGFWTKTYEGERPIDRLRNKVIESLKEAKTKQRLLEEAGIVKRLSFSELKENMERENTQRKKAGEKGEIVYGMNSFSVAEYYRWYYSQGEAELQNTFRKTFPQPEEKELRKYFERTGPYLGNVSGKILICQAPEGFDSVRAKDFLETIRAVLNEGKSRKELMERMDEFYHAVPVCQEQNLYEREIGKEDERQQKRMELFRIMQPFEVSETLEFGNQYEVFQVMEKEGGVPKTFEEAKNIVLYQYVGDAYREYLEEQILKTKVVMEEKETWERFTEKQVNGESYSSLLH